MTDLARIAELAREIVAAEERLEGLRAELRALVRGAPGPRKTRAARQRHVGPLSEDAIRRAEEVSRRHGIEPGGE